jgi:hypothetical protein
MQVGDGATLWEGGGGPSHHYRNVYMRNTATTHIVKFVSATAQSAPVDTIYGSHWKDFIWEQSAEFNPSCLFLVSGNRSDVSFPGMIVRAGNVMLDVAGFMFRIDPTSSVTRVLLQDVDLFVPQWWRAGSKLFDQPVKYVLNGNVTMLQASIAAWQPPGGGFVRFTTDLGKDALTGFYGLIEDGNGANLTTTSLSTASLVAAGQEVFLRGDKGLGLRWNSSSSPNGFEFEIGGGIMAIVNNVGNVFARTFTTNDGEIYLRGDNGLGLRWNNNAFEFEISGGMVASISNSGNIFGNTFVANGGEIYLRGDNGIGLRWNANQFQFMIGATVSAAFDNSGRLQNNGVQVVGGRVPGWGGATGTATRSTFATTSVTLPQLAEHVKALLDDLATHGLIGT